MTISFERNSDFTERRRQGRAPLELEVFVRERGRSAMATRLVDFSSYGCQVDGLILVQRNTQLWVRLPGLASQPVQLVWNDGTRCGLQFDAALHPAVAARFMPAQGSHAAAAIDNVIPFPDPLLSRREQIMSGIAGTDHSPLQRKKKPSGLGMLGRINRTVSRQSDTRLESRFADAVPEGTSLRVEGVPVRVVNVSPSGMRVFGDIRETEIGNDLAIEFEGFDPMAGRLVWLNGPEAGIALPPQSIELFDRIAG
ncbi:MAG: PilZ domain-containing protein [Novosphingobium sp.]